MLKYSLIKLAALNLLFILVFYAVPGLPLTLFGTPSPFLLLLSSHLFPRPGHYLIPSLLTSSPGCVEPGGSSCGQARAGGRSCVHTAALPSPTQPEAHSGPCNSQSPAPSSLQILFYSASQGLCPPCSLTQCLRQTHSRGPA